MQLADQLSVASLTVATITLFVAIVGVRVGLRTLRHSNRNASAASLLTIQETFREAWARYFNETDPKQKHYELGDLANIIEVACALESEETFTGVSHRLLSDYLENIVSIIKGHHEMRRSLNLLADKPDTFEYLKGFLVRRGLTD